LVEVFPFTKFNWRSEAIAEEWEPLRRRIYQAVNFAEYESVKRHLRRCDVYDLTPSNFDNQIKKVFLDGLYFLPILRSKTYGGYGYRHYHATTIDENTFIYGVVSHNLEDAITFHDAGVVDVKQRIRDYPTKHIDHNKTGELLGYPECDRRFFQETWLKDGCLDPMHEVALNTESVEKIKAGHVKVSGSVLLNRLIRYWGFNLIPFFPHSFDCEEAITYGKWWFKLMQEHDQAAADACLSALSMPMVWSLQNCIIRVEHPLFSGSANGYYTSEKKVVEWFPE